MTEVCGRDCRSNVTVTDRLVLVVDDAADVRETIVAIFEDLGFAVIQAAGGQEALDILDNRDLDVALLFTDVQMPRMSGPQLAVAARKLRPSLKIILSSGETRNPRIGSPFIGKPFRRSLLAALVTETLAG